MGDEKVEKIHEELMEELQIEWLSFDTYHKNQREKNWEGIRSSQVSALVMLLVKKGVLQKGWEEYED